MKRTYSEQSTFQVFCAPFNILLNYEQCLDEYYTLFILWSPWNNSYSDRLLVEESNCMLMSGSVILELLILKKVPLFVLANKI